MQEAIRLWEELRQHETPPARRLELVSSILALIKGHMVNVAASPTASRIIQSCVKHGSPAHRAQVWPLMCGFRRSYGPFNSRPGC